MFPLHMLDSKWVSLIETGSQCSVACVQINNCDVLRSQWNHMNDANGIQFDFIYIEIQYMPLLIGNIHNSTSFILYL